MARLIDARATPHPLHTFFVGVGGSLLIAALFTDMMYANTSLMQWANFSAWLLTAGLILALVSVLVLGADFAFRRVGSIRWIDFGLVATAALLSLVNVLVHTRDAWTSVIPTGLTLSIIVAVLLIVVGFRGWRVTNFREMHGGVEA